MVDGRAQCFAVGTNAAIFIWNWTEYEEKFSVLKSIKIIITLLYWPTITQYIYIYKYILYKVSTPTFFDEFATSSGSLALLLCSIYGNY